MRTFHDAGTEYAEYAWEYRGDFSTPMEARDAYFSDLEKAITAHTEMDSDAAWEAYDAYNERWAALGGAGAASPWWAGGS